MSGQKLQQTPEAVRRLTANSIRERLALITWLSPEDRGSLERMMLGIMPRFDELLHAERLRKFATGRTQSGDIRAAGVMLLSNMLNSLARQTTTEEKGTDRNTVVYAVVKRLHALILDNLEDMKPHSIKVAKELGGEPSFSTDQKKIGYEGGELAGLILDLVEAYFGAGDSADARVIAVAFASAAGSFLHGMQEDARTGFCEHFAKTFFEYAGVPLKAERV